MIDRSSRTNMGRAPGNSKSSLSTASPGACTCCSSALFRRGPWTAEEDELLSAYMMRVGGARGNWRKVPKEAGLLRCGKSCRLRWLNYLRPDLKRGSFSEDEEELIIRLHSLLGNRWSLIAGRIPGRSDNEIKNYWNFHLGKKLRKMGLDPRTHRPLEVARQVPSLASPCSKEDESKTPDLNQEKSLSPWSSFSSTTSSMASKDWDLDGALEERSQESTLELVLTSPVADDWIFSLCESRQPLW